MWTTPRTARTRDRSRGLATGPVAATVVLLGLLAGIAGVLAAPVLAAPRAGTETDEPATGDRLREDPEVLAGHVDALMDELVGVQVPGAAVAIVDGDDVLHADGYGVADVTTGESVSVQETAFMVGSVGKLVTFTAVMQGVEDGVLDLDEDIATYLADSRVDVAHDEYGPITLRHLGTHTAGFEFFTSPGFVADPEAVPTLEEAAAAEDRPERVRPPGELVAYSNFGTLLAGHVVEEAYGTGFDEHVRERIFAPLEMTHATFAQPVPDDHPGTLAASHVGGDGDFERVDPPHIGWRPAGSLAATATDVAAFMSAHLGAGAQEDARILEPETAEAMHAVHHVRHPAVANVRYGFWEQHQDPDNIRHDGATLYDTAELLLAPEDGLGFFAAFNIRGTASPVELVEDIARAFDVVPEAPGPPGQPEQAATERAEAVAGEYRSTFGDGPALSQVSGVLGAVTLTPDGDGGLRLSTLETEDRFVEVEPHVYRQVDGHDVVAADIEDGEPVALHLSSVPQAAFQPVPLHERLQVVAALLVGALGVFLLSLIGRAGVGFRRHRRHRRRADRGQAPRPDQTGPGARAAGLARGAGIALSVAALAWVALFGWSLAAYGQAVALEPLPLRFAFAVPYLIALLAVATVVGTALAWRRGYWTVGARIHHTLLAVAGVVLLWPLHVLALL